MLVREPINERKISRKLFQPSLNPIARFGNDSIDEMARGEIGLC